jgi:hypothetical protein
MLHDKLRLATVKAGFHFHPVGLLITLNRIAESLLEFMGRLHNKWNTWLVTRHMPCAKLFHFCWYLLSKRIHLVSDERA